MGRLEQLPVFCYQQEARCLISLLVITQFAMHHGQLPDISGRKETTINRFIGSSTIIFTIVSAVLFVVMCFQDLFLFLCGRLQRGCTDNGLRMWPCPAGIFFIVATVCWLRFQALATADHVSSPQLPAVSHIARRDLSVAAAVGCCGCRRKC